MNDIKQRDEIRKKMEEKRYFVTVYSCGDEQMSNGKKEKQVSPKMTYHICSTLELRDIIKFTYRGFWENHTDKEDKDVSFEEKKFGLYHEVKIEPLTKEMEESYIKASKDGFFEIQRKLYEETEVAVREVQ